jgi:hypothetical protein
VFVTDRRFVEKTVFWNVTQRSLVDIKRRFRGVYRLHHQGVESENKACIRAMRLQA